jgi:hypothetical protein
MRSVNFPLEQAGWGNGLNLMDRSLFVVSAVALRLIGLVTTGVIPVRIS